MLQQLSIHNYAIIDELQVSFSNRLNIITGETGAGKSILMGALGLILGERADSTVLVDTSRKCLVEAQFSTPGEAVQAFLQEADLDADDSGLIIRREIAPNGKSRSFVNDTPVTLQQLKQLGRLLVDLHQQFDTLELNSEAFQREVIDALANHRALLLQYQDAFKQWQAHTQALSRLRQEQAEAQATLDYHQFLFDELEDANFQENELEQLDQELLGLTHADQVQAELSGAAFQLRESETPLVQQLKVLVNRLQGIVAYQPSLEELITRLQSAQVELTDIAQELAYASAGLAHDPARLQWVNERLALGYRLQKKHQVTDTAGLRAIHASLQAKLDLQLNLDTAITEAEKLVQQRHKACVALAKQLGEQRRKAIPGFEVSVNKLLGQVGMPNARFQVGILATDLQAHGADDIRFLFDANKSGRFEPLSKVGSGGELSRIMLSIKSLVAAQLQLPTLIFDEIDTGISGEAARQVGLIMRSLAGAHQLIAITHQPQIAALGHAHYFVYKADRGLGRIQTSIRQLEEAERVQVIAQMLSGEQPTPAALANAQELMRQ